MSKIEISKCTEKCQITYPSGSWRIVLLTNDSINQSTNQPIIKLKMQVISHPKGVVCQGNKLFVRKEYITRFGQEVFYYTRDNDSSFII